MVGGRVARGEARSLAAALLEREGLADAADRGPVQVGAGVLMRAGVAGAGPVAADDPVRRADERARAGAVRRFDALLLELRAQGVGALVISHDLPSILHVPDEVHLLHEGRIHLAAAARVRGKCPVVRQFIDGRADGPLPVW